MDYIKDLDAKHYRNNSSFQYELAQEVLQTHSFQDSDHLLDLGCGDGRISAELAKRLHKGKVIGVDLSPSMISLAKSSFPENEYPNLAFFVCHAEKINYSNQFNVAISFNCLHWVENKKKVFTKLVEALVPGGSLLLLFGHRNSTFPHCFDEILIDKRWAHYTSHAAFLKKELHADNYKEFLRELGIQIIEFKLQEKIAIFDSKDELCSFIKIWIHYYFPLPPELQTEFLDLVMDKMISLISTKKDKDNRLYLPFNNLVINGKKAT